MQSHQPERIDSYLSWKQIQKLSKQSQSCQWTLWSSKQCSSTYFIEFGYDLFWENCSGRGLCSALSAVAWGYAKIKKQYDKTLSVA